MIGSVVRPFPPETEKVAALRAELPATSAGIYLDTGSAGPLPRDAARVMAETADRELEVGRAHRDRRDEIGERLDEARGAVAAIVGSDLRDVAITGSASEGCARAAWALDWQPGDGIVVSDGEHPGGYDPLRRLIDRLGLEHTVVRVTTASDDDATLRAFDAAITPRTRLVLAPHVAWGTGALLPVRGIADIAHAKGALLAVDVGQSAGTIEVRASDLGADFLGVAAHTWLLGPEGVGALVVAESARHRVIPTIPWFGSNDGSAPRGAGGTAAVDARIFDSSDWYPPTVVGFARSCGWLSMHVGLPWIHERATDLAARAAARLAVIPGVDLITPIDRMASLVTFRITGWPADAAVEVLGRRIFAIVRSIPDLDAIRMSVAFFNTDAEIARFCEAVEELARFTPDTLPGRPVLVILEGDVAGRP